jgi:hypothetical protein
MLRLEKRWTGLRVVGPVYLQRIDKITAIEMARKALIDPRLFSQVLRYENFDSHKRHDRWTVEIGGAEHKAMHRVLNLISKGRWRID